jgi:two-component system chemotaxis response regulator CheB
MSHIIRVVVVDDSALMRRMITTLIERDPAIRVVGVARDGREAISVVEELRPDIITMDVRMPNMDGLATTEHLMAYNPTPILVLTASLASHEVDITFKMLQAGALEVIEKPNNTDPLALERAGLDLIRRIKTLAKVKVVTHLRGRRKLSEQAVEANPLKQPLAPSSSNATKTNASIAFNGNRTQAPSDLAPQMPVIVIGASTGGPRIVHQILRDLPSNLPAAVIVVQHIAAGFSVGMAEWLSASSALPVTLAYEGQSIRAGEVLIAPDQRDLMITSNGSVHLNENPLLIQRPAIDVTMQAAAEVFGPRAIGVLLTGMGRDGAYGMLTIRRAGGYTIAQDEASCAIFGMPRAAIQLGAANDVLAPAQIITRLTELVAEQLQTAPVRAYNAIQANSKF